MNSCSMQITVSVKALQSFDTKVYQKMCRQKSGGKFRIGRGQGNRCSGSIELTLCFSSKLIKFAQKGNNSLSSKISCIVKFKNVCSIVCSLFHWLLLIVSLSLIYRKTSSWSAGWLLRWHGANWRTVEFIEKREKSHGRRQCSEKQTAADC